MGKAALKPWKSKIPYHKPLFQDFYIRRSPLQKVDVRLMASLGLELYLKRDDLLDPLISGNKWRKLKYNLVEMEMLGKKGIITFGGAFSNHLHAVAAAGERFGFPTVGIVRGEKSMSPTLEDCQNRGMIVHFVSREVYRQKQEAMEVKSILSSYPSLFLVPEGGANRFGEMGCGEILEEIDQEFDYFCVACGTGTTLAGLVASKKSGVQMMGFPVLKGITDYPSLTKQDCQLMTEYHFGGYAKCTSELVDFIREFEKETDVPLEQVYTGKMMYGIYDLAKKGYFPRGSRIIALHTGGLQGRSHVI